MKNEWKKKWRSTVRLTAHPGVYERREGGFLIRSLVTEKSTGRRREIKRVLPNADLQTAVATLALESKRVRDGLTPTGTSKTRFAKFAADIFDHQKRSTKLAPWRSRSGYLQNSCTFRMRTPPPRSSKQQNPEAAT